MQVLELLADVLTWLDWREIAGSGVVVAAFGFAWSRWNERVDRRRKLFADALVAVSRYKEFPFVIRRREATDPAAERLRISSELRQVQADLTFYEAWIETEADEVAEKFSVLVDRTRAVAGGLMRDAWREPPLFEDSAMNQPDVGKALSELKAYERAYIRSVSRELSIWKVLPGR